MGSRNPLFIVVFRASSHVQIFHLNVICSIACCVPMGSRNLLYIVVFRASSHVQIFHLNMSCSNRGITRQAASVDQA